MENSPTEVAAVPSTLRAGIANMERALARLGGNAGPIGLTPASREVLDAWDLVLKLLAFQPEPETRECPSCKKTGMRAAVRCGYCWTELTPPPPGA
jgi:hypothetical protein